MPIPSIHSRYASAESPPRSEIEPESRTSPVATPKCEMLSLVPILFRCVQLPTHQNAKRCGCGSTHAKNKKSSDGRTRANSRIFCKQVNELSRRLRTNHTHTHQTHTEKIPNILPMVMCTLSGECECVKQLRVR